MLFLNKRPENAAEAVLPGSFFARSHIPEVIFSAKALPNAIFYGIVNGSAGDDDRVPCGVML